jgi:hypothetical protein
MGINESKEGSIYLLYWYKRFVIIELWELMSQKKGSYIYYMGTKDL